MALYAVKTTASQEETVADMIARRESDDIHSVLAAADMTSYIIVEASDVGPIERAIEEIPHANGILEGKTSISEVEHFFETTSDVQNVHEGDVVEITGGPYSGETAHVQRVDESSEEVTVELSEATVPIPITMRGDKVRVIDSDERD